MPLCKNAKNWGKNVVAKKNTEGGEARVRVFDGLYHFLGTKRFTCLLKVGKENQETWIKLHALRMEKVKSLLWKEILRKDGEIAFTSYLMNDLIFCNWIG